MFALNGTSLVASDLFYQREIPVDFPRITRFSIDYVKTEALAKRKSRIHKKILLSKTKNFIQYNNVNLGGY